jgi:ATP-dependent protease Clp ATPase subunit
MAAQMTYACTFCGQPQEAVQRLLVGPNGVYICNDCITLCHSIIAGPSGHEVHDDARADDSEVQVLRGELASARVMIDQLMRENAALRAQPTPPAAE